MKKRTMILVLLFAFNFAESQITIIPFAESQITTTPIILANSDTVCKTVSIITLGDTSVTITEGTNQIAMDENFVNDRIKRVNMELQMNMEDSIRTNEQLFMNRKEKSKLKLIKKLF